MKKLIIFIMSILFLAGCQQAPVIPTPDPPKNEPLLLKADWSFQLNKNQADTILFNGYSSPFVRMTAISNLRINGLPVQMQVDFAQKIDSKARPYIIISLHELLPSGLESENALELIHFDDLEGPAIWGDDKAYLNKANGRYEPSKTLLNPPWMFSTKEDMSSGIVDLNLNGWLYYQP